MAGRKSVALPADIARVEKRFAAWRRKKKPRERVPAELWKAAVKLVGIHGLYRVSSALKLDYYSLKKQVEAASPPKREVASFVELGPVAGSSECVIELEDGTGASLRVTLRGHAAPDVAALAGSFWKLG